MECSRQHDQRLGEVCGEETIIAANTNEQRQPSAVPSDAPRVSNALHRTPDTSRLIPNAKRTGKDEYFSNKTNKTPRPLAQVGRYRRPSGKSFLVRICKGTVWPSE